MPTADEHQRQADHHLAFLHTIDAEEFCDWLTVVAFYVAVHLIERLRALEAEHSEDHADRLDFVRERHPTIHSYYRQLFNWAWIARYEATDFNWLVPDRVHGVLEEIQRYVGEYTPPE